jgi:hypothetical protein
LFGGALRRVPLRTTFLALPWAYVFGAAANPVSRRFGGSAIPAAIAGAQQLCAARCGRLRFILNCPPEPTAQRYQGCPIREPERNLTGPLVDGGEAVGLVWSLNNLYATHDVAKRDNRRTVPRVNCRTNPTAGPLRTSMFFSGLVTGNPL